MLASVIDKAKALSGLNSKFISYTLKDLQGLCSNQLFKDSASSTFGSTLLLGLGQLPVQPDDRERELLVGGLWKQPWMLYISSVRVPLARNQMATGVNCEGGWETWCSCVPGKENEFSKLPVSLPVFLNFLFYSFLNIWK